MKKLMAILAHPDDESLGVGGTLAKYAAEGVDVALLTATRGERGRFHGHRPETEEHPGTAALAGIREQELRAAVSVLGVRRVSLLNYPDQQLACANPHDAIAAIAGELRRSRPDVVVTFGPDGAYGTSRSHRHFPIHHGGRHGCRRSGVRLPRRRRGRATALGFKAACTWPGRRRPLLRINQPSGSCRPRWTASCARPRHGPNGRSRR